MGDLFERYFSLFLDEHPTDGYRGQTCPYPWGESRLAVWDVRDDRTIEDLLAALPDQDARYANEAGLIDLLNEIDYR